MSTTLMISTYGIATRVLGPLTPIWLHKRAHAGKEDMDRMSERHGETDVKRPDGKLVWVHAASVGESQMILPLIHRFLDTYPELHILCTTGTVTSAELMEDRLPKRCIHQYIPLDYPTAVRNFLNHWKPDLALWSESEIWPNLIRKTKELGIPMAIVNARMSKKSLANWSTKAQKSARVLFGAFDLILAANQETAYGLEAITQKTVEMTGNLKDAASPLPVVEKDFKRLSQNIGKRPVWCAASTHEGEDEIILDAHKDVLKFHPSALLILAPRHPKRANAIRALLQERDLNFVSRSDDASVPPQTSVFLFDSIGEMGLAYRLSDLSFVCGSLLKGLSGHNPLEPARLNNAVLTGVHVSSFADTYMSMFTFNAARRILNTEKIAPTIIELFEKPQHLEDLKAQSQAFANSRDAVLDYVWEKLSPLMKNLGNAAA